MGSENKEIAERLCEFRKYLKLNQVEMGKKLGITQSSYAMIENGNNELKSKHIQNMINNDNLNPLWLLTGSGNMIHNPGSPTVIISDNIGKSYNVLGHNTIIHEQNMIYDKKIVDEFEAIKKDNFALSKKIEEMNVMIETLMSVIKTLKSS